MLRTRKIGSKVHFIAHAGAMPHNGILKALHPTDCNIVYVSYDLREISKTVRGLATHVDDLHEGWVE